MKCIKEREVKERQAREKDIEEKQRKIETERKELEDQRIQIEDRLSRQNTVVDEKESTRFAQELYEKRQRLKAKQFEIQEKNAILEITLKINKKEERLAIQLKNSKAMTLANGENQLVVTREREIEERENELTLRQHSLEERELQLEKKSSILDIAIRLNQFRYKIKINMLHITDINVIIFLSSYFNTFLSKVEILQIDKDYHSAPQN